MKVIVGLGNITREYEKTRHNAGFMAVNKIADFYSFNGFEIKDKFEAEIAAGIIRDKKTILVKPQTYMNASGRAVQKIVDFYRIKPKDLIVIHDDLDIMLGNLRLAFGRSSAGHKGVQSIIDCLGTKDFNRIRIGIQISDRKIPTEKFVLAAFSKKEMAAVSAVIDGLPETIEKELM